MVAMDHDQIRGQSLINLSEAYFLLCLACHTAWE